MKHNATQCNLHRLVPVEKRVAYGEFNRKKLSQRRTWHRHITSPITTNR